MPVIQNLASGGAPSAYRFSPLNLGQEPPAALPVDTSAASNAAAHAALMGTVAKTISDLPSMLLGNYVKGKQVGVQMKATDTLNDVLSGTATEAQKQALAGTTVTPDSVTYKGPGVLSDIEKRDKEADIVLKTEHGKYYHDKVNATPSKTEDNPFWITAPGDDTATPSAGTVTTYGNIGDRFGGPGTTSATKNAMGGNLTPQSMAVSPDRERELKAKGFKIGDRVALKMDDGSTVERIWDDRTAQWDPTGQWSVDDKGNKIPDGHGGFLPALKGRWDLPAVDGKPHPLNGRKVTGFAKPGTPFEEPALPSGPAGPPGMTPPPAPGAGALGGVSGEEYLRKWRADTGGDIARLEALPNKTQEQLNTLAALKANAADWDSKNPAPVAQPVGALSGAPADMPPPAQGALPGVPPAPVAAPNPEVRANLLSEAQKLDFLKRRAPEQFTPEQEARLGTVKDQITAIDAAAKPPVAGALAGTPTAAPVAAPGGPPAPATPQAAPSSTEAMMNATGGRLITEDGNAHGKVYQFPNFQREELPDGTVYIYPKQTKPGQKPFFVLKKPDSGTSVPAQIKSEAIRMGVWKDKMTGEEASKAMEEKSLKEGIVPPHLLPAAESMARFVVGHPALKHLPTIREAKEAVDAGLDNQDTGGFGDMAIVEGFQRMVNPGATVRSQTMDQMLKAAGMGQYTDLAFVMDHFKEGEKFSPEVRGRLKKLSADIYARVMRNAGPQMTGLKKVARSYGISNPDDFIDNVLTMAPLYGADGAPAPAGVAGPTPAPSPIAPEAATAQKAAAADVVLSKYKAGAYTGADKEKAERLLRAAGKL